jgi:hypothetical protein
MVSDSWQRDVLEPAGHYRSCHIAALAGPPPLSLKFGFISADDLIMGNSAYGSWRVKKKGQSIGVIGSDSSVIAVLPQRDTDDNSRVKEAYLMAAAPQLFSACIKIKEMLENSLVVTREGFVINCSEIRDTLLDATLRASGCRKTPDEP